MDDEPERNRAARRAAERALVRVVHHYGGRPEFVVLGGLVPELLCSGSDYQHAGTTDVDVQVDLELAALCDLQANFADPRAQGPEAYADQMLVDHDGLDGATLRADAVLAVTAFCEALLIEPAP